MKGRAYSGRRLVIFLVAGMMSASCAPSGNSNGRTTSGATIASMWKYEKSGCVLTPGHDGYGDGEASCIYQIEITKFADGSAFVAVNGYDGDTNSMIEWSYFLKAGTTTFTKRYYSSGAEQVFSGDISLGPPTFAANADNNGSLGDTAPKSFTLTEE